MAGDHRSETYNTRSAATSPVVKHLLPFFAFVDAGQTIQRRLSDIDEGLVAQFIERKRQERAILTDLADKLAEASAQELQDLELLRHFESVDLDEDEVVLLRRYGQRGGCHQASRTVGIAAQKRPSTADPTIRRRLGL